MLCRFICVPAAGCRVVAVCCSNKKDILRNLMADDVWPMIYDTYRVNYLPWNSKIYYYLIIRKRLNSLIVYNGISKIVKMIIKGTW